MYRIKLNRTSDGLGLVLSERDVARLCLAEGDELVVAEVMRTPAYQPEMAEDQAAFDLDQAPVPTNGHAVTEPAPPSVLPPAAEPLALSEGDAAEPKPDQTEIDKSAFRRFAR